MLRPRRGLASDRQGQLVECDRHPPGRRLLARQLYRLLERYNQPGVVILKAA
jgi:hypothetical protein